MKSTRKKLSCEKCGRAFYEYVPDSVDPKTAILLVHPLCKKCRSGSIHGKLWESKGKKI